MIYLLDILLEDWEIVLLAVNIEGLIGAVSDLSKVSLRSEYVADAVFVLEHVMMF